MSDVWLLVVKGNLRHRIEKLGVEKADADLSQGQRRLREAARLQNFGPGQAGEPEHPERPAWANGAFVYLTPNHAAKICQAAEVSGLQLQSKHVLVSEEYRALVKEVLATGPNGPGREAFLLRRAGAVEREDRVNLPVDPQRLGGSLQQQCRAEGGSEASFESCLTPNTGTATTYRTAGTTASGDPGTHRKHVRLLQLDGRLMERREVDLELAEYLTAPPSVQQMDPDMWTRAWDQVCEENRWIEMRPDEKCGPCPYCTVCKKWAEVGHLMSKTCRARLERHGMQVGPLLEAILQAEETRRHARQSISAAAPAPAAGHGPSSSAHAPRPLPPPPPAPAPAPRAAPGRCPTPWCEFSAPGPGSATHCCRRCELAHRAGHRLTTNPETGSPWKKAHGHLCTGRPPPAQVRDSPSPAEEREILCSAPVRLEAGQHAAAPPPDPQASPPEAARRGPAAEARGCLPFLRRAGRSRLPGLSASLRALSWRGRSTASVTASSTDNLPLGADHSEFRAPRAEAAPAARRGGACGA